MKKFAANLIVVLGAFCFITLSSALATHITSSSDPALVGATLIDFESQTIGVYNSLTIGVVTFTANDNHLRVGNEYAGNYGTTGKSLDNGTYDSEGFFGLTINFSSPTSAFGFKWGAAEPSAIWNLRAYDSSNNLLDTYLLPDTSSDPTGAFVGLAVSNISYATLINSTDYDWIFIDNFTYQPGGGGGGEVPEPATMLLVGSGLIGLAGYGRKKFFKK